MVVSSKIDTLTTSLNDIRLCNLVAKIFISHTSLAYISNITTVLQKMSQQIIIIIIIII